MARREEERESKWREGEKVRKERENERKIERKNECWSTRKMLPRLLEDSTLNTCKNDE